MSQAYAETSDLTNCPDLFQEIALIANSMDKANANQSKVILASPLASPELFENRSQSPETVAGESNSEMMFAPTVSKAR